MTATTQDKVGSYAPHQRQNEDGRETDKRALLSCARRLQEALDDGGKDMKAYADAIRHNQHLWTVFQVALCDPANELPKSLKVTLLNLSRYVDRTSFRAISEYMPQLLNSLIEINRIIAGGLSKQPAATQTSAAAMPDKPPVSGSVMTSA
jgi:flagellar protein FlaF